MYSRPKIFFVLIGVGLFGITTQMFTGLLGLNSCWKTFIWRYFFPNPVPGYALRAFFLERLSSLQYRYFKQSRQSDIDDEEERIKIDDLKKKLDWKYLIRFYASFHGFQVLLFTLSIIYNSVTIPSDELHFENICAKTFFTTILDVFNALVMIFAIVYFGWKLRTVKDAYLVQKEFRWIGITSIIFGFLGWAFQLGGDKFRLVSSMVMLCCFTTHSFISYGVIGLKTIQEANRSSYSSSGDDNISKSITSGQDEENYVEHQFVPFKKNSQIRTLYQNPFSSKNVEEYITYIQSIQGNMAYTCLSAICEINKKTREERIGFIYAKIYSKYIKRDGYLPLQFLEEDFIKSVDMHFLEYLRSLENETQNNDDIYETLHHHVEKLQHQVEQYLENEIFHKYFKSEYYQNCKIGLSLGKVDV